MVPTSGSLGARTIGTGIILIQGWPLTVTTISLLGQYQQNQLKTGLTASWNQEEIQKDHPSLILQLGCRQLETDKGRWKEWGKFTVDKDLYKLTTEGVIPLHLPCR